jgi:hypothetical protein
VASTLPTATGPQMRPRVGVDHDRGAARGDLRRRRRRDPPVSGAARPVGRGLHRPRVGALLGDGTAPVSSVDAAQKRRRRPRAPSPSARPPAAVPTAHDGLALELTLTATARVAVGRSECRCGSSTDIGRAPAPLRHAPA